MPAISQWPVVVSFPFDARAHLPNDPIGAWTDGTPLSGRILPRPRDCRLGKLTFRDASICPKVSAPASPQSAASGISPMPALSSTIRQMRSNSNDILRFYGTIGVDVKPPERLALQRINPAESFLRNGL